MPDPIRIAVEGFGAHPQHKARARARARARDVGLRAAGAIALAALIPCGRACAAAADARFEFPADEAEHSALPSLERAVRSPDPYLSQAATEAINAIRVRGGA